MTTNTGTRFSDSTGTRRSDRHRSRSRRGAAVVVEEHRQQRHPRERGAPAARTSLPLSPSSSASSGHLTGPLYGNNRPLLSRNRPCRCRPPQHGPFPAAGSPTCSSSCASASSLLEPLLPTRTTATTAAASTAATRTTTKTRIRASCSCNRCHDDKEKEDDDDDRQDFLLPQRKDDGAGGDDDCDDDDVNSGSIRDNPCIPRHQQAERRLQQQQQPKLLLRERRQQHERLGSVGCGDDSDGEGDSHTSSRNHPNRHHPPPSWSSSQGSRMSCPTTTTDATSTDNPNHNHNHNNHDNPNNPIVTTDRSRYYRDELSTLVWELVVPTVWIQSVGSNIPNCVVASWVGRYCGAGYLDGYAVANLTGNLCTLSLLQGVASACDSYMPRAYARRRYSQVGVLAIRAYAACTVLVLPVTMLLQWRLPWMLRRIGVSATTSRYAYEWYRIYIWSMPFYTLYMVLWKYLSATCQHQQQHQPREHPQQQGQQEQQQHPQEERMQPLPDGTEQGNDAGNSNNQQEHEQRHVQQTRDPIGSGGVRCGATQGGSSNPRTTQQPNRPLVSTWEVPDQDVDDRVDTRPTTSSNDSHDPKNEMTVQQRLFATAGTTSSTTTSPSSSSATRSPDTSRDSSWDSSSDSMTAPLLASARMGTETADTTAATDTPTTLQPPPPTTTTTTTTTRTTTLMPILIASTISCTAVLPLSLYCVQYYVDSSRRSRRHSGRRDGAGSLDLALSNDDDDEDTVLLLYGFRGTAVCMLLHHIFQSVSVLVYLMLRESSGSSSSSRSLSASSSSRSAALQSSESPLSIQETAPHEFLNTENDAIESNDSQTNDNSNSNSHIAAIRATSSFHPPSCWPGWNRETIRQVFDRKPFWEFVSLGLGGVLASSGWIYWEVIALLIGSRLGDVALSVHTIPTSILSVIYMIPKGIGVALSVRLSALLATDADRAKRLVRYAAGICSVLIAAITIGLYASRYVIFGLFTTETNVLDGADSIWPNVTIYYALTAIFGVNMGIATGMGLQWIQGTALVGTLWCIGLPCTYYFAVVRRNGIDAVWACFWPPYLIIDIIMLIVFITKDWTTLSRKDQDDHAMTSIVPEETMDHSREESAPNPGESSFNCLMSYSSDKAITSSTMLGAEDSYETSSATATSSESDEERIGLLL